MTALAFRARPPLAAAVALLGLSVAAHEGTRPRDSHAPLPAVSVPALAFAATLPGDVLEPPALADAQPWPRGMVIAPPATGDRMVASPLTTLLSGLFELFGSLGA